MSPRRMCAGIVHVIRDLTGVEYPAHCKRDIAWGKSSDLCWDCARAQARGVRRIVRIDPHGGLYGQEEDRR